MWTCCSGDAGSTPAELVQVDKIPRKTPTSGTEEHISMTFKAEEAKLPDPVPPAKLHDPALPVPPAAEPEPEDRGNGHHHDAAEAARALLKEPEDRGHGHHSGSFEVTGTVAERALVRELVKSNCFDIEIEKGPDQRLGLFLDGFSSGLMQVLTIHEGPVSAYNQATPEERQVRRGDFLAAVNGSRVGPEMLRCIKEENPLKLTFVRPVELKLTVNRDGRPLGLGLFYGAESSICLEVKEINPGAAQRYNKHANPEEQIRTFDFIAAVNGVSDSGDKMLEELKASDVVELRLLRCLT